MRLLNINILGFFFALLLIGAFVPTYLNGAHEVGHVDTTGVDLIDTILDQLNNPDSTTTSVSQGFSRDGVYGCTGASFGSVGLQGPTGAHVPVFDDAVHDQERLLTYKECLLDGIVNSMRETLISFIIKSIVQWTNTGFEGNPSYVTDIPQHMLERISDPEAQRIITGAETEAISEPFRRDVRVALAKYYSNKTRRPQNELACDVPDDQLEAFLDGDFYGGGGWSTFYQLTTTESCNPVFAYRSAQDRLDEALAAEQARENTQLLWGSGFRSVERDRQIDLGDGDTQDVQRIVTPGFMIAEHLRQTLGTGLRQSENADEIDEIISALMANLGTEMLTDFEGLSGLSRSFGGRGSYIERLASDSASRTRGNLTGAAIAIINNTIRVEQEYAAARQGSAGVLAQSDAQLKAWERTCWDAIVDQAKTDLAAQVEARACASQGSQGNNNSNNPVQCSISASVTESIATNAIDVHVTSVGHITVRGRATAGGSTISLLVAQGNQSVPLPPLQLASTTEGSWVSPEIDVTPLPDGTLNVTSVETLSAGGTAAPVIATIQKQTTISGIEIIPPTTRPAITITATAGGVSATATITPDTIHSTSVSNQNIRPLVTLIRENIFRAGKALEVLSQLQAALANTNSASAQRFLLERIDQLVAARALHTEAQLRQARDQAVEIEGAMQQLLSETKDGWENGWCDPDNWQQHST